MTNFIYILALYSLLASIGCRNNGATVVDNKPIIDSLSTQKKVTFKEAGVYFIRNELTDSNYIKRAATMIPSIEQGMDGELYCGWYSNKSTRSANGEGSGAYVTLSLSVDEGNTWLDNALVVAPIDTLDRIFDLSLWRDGNGLIHMFWSRSIRSFWDGKGSVWECVVKFDKITGTLTYSKPKLFIPMGVMINKPIVLTNESKILYPHYVYNLPNSITQGIAGIYLYSGESPKPNIRELGLPSKVSNIPFLPKGLVSAYFEPQLLQLDQDTIACFIRVENGGMHISKSSMKSNLMIWTPFEKLTQIGVNAPMRFCIQRLNSGNILLITCNNKDRINMTAYLSIDNGRTFKYRVSLDKRSGVSYPDFTITNEGKIFAVWDRGRTSVDKEIVFASFTEDDIINNAKIKLIKVNGF